MTLRIGLTVGVSLVLAACAGVDSEQDLVATAEQAVNVCDATVAANLVVDGIPAYAQCTASNNAAIYSNNGVDTATSAIASDWKQTQRSGGYQCTELIHRYWLFKWNISWIPNGNAGTWCSSTPPSTSGIVQTTTPVHGDAIVFAPGVCGASSSTGHVALIDTVDTAASKVTFVEQNGANRRTSAWSCATCFLHVSANDGSAGSNVGGAGGALAVGGASTAGGASAASGGTATRGGSSGLGGAVPRGGAASSNGGRSSVGGSPNPTVGGGSLASGGSSVSSGGRVTSGGSAVVLAGGSSTTASGGSKGDGGNVQNGGAVSVGGALAATGGTKTAASGGASTSVGGNDSTSTLAVGGAAQPGDSQVDPDAGCGCHIPSGHGSQQALGWLSVAVALLFRNRRLAAREGKPRSRA